MAPRINRKVNPKILLEAWQIAQYELEMDPEYAERQRVINSRRINRIRHKTRRENESWRIRTGFHWMWVLCTIFVIVVLAGNYREGNWSTIHDLWMLSDLAHFGLLWLGYGTLTVITLITRIIPNE